MEIVEYLKFHFEQTFVCSAATAAERIYTIVIKLQSQTYALA